MQMVTGLRLTGGSTEHSAIMWRIARAITVVLSLAALIILLSASWISPSTKLDPKFSTATKLRATPSEISQFIQSQTTQGNIDFLNRETDQPIWIEFAIPTRPSEVERVLEIPILRLTKISETRVWLLKEGRGNEREFIEVPIKDILSSGHIRAGLSIALQGNEITGALVEVTSLMPGTPTGNLWESSDYKTQKSRFDRLGGMLFGCILALVSFGLLVALINKEADFLLYCGLLLTSLRIGAINAGWDKFWLEIPISEYAYLAILRASMAGYGFFNISIYKRLSRTLESDAPPSIALSGLQVVFAGFAIASPFLTHTEFLKAFWTLAVISAGILAVKIVPTLIKSSTPSSALFFLSWLTMLAGMIGELCNMSGFARAPDWLNSQLGAVLSAVILGLALINKLSTEKDKRITAQALSLEYLKDFERNFNLSPIGLFSISNTGHLRLFNPSFREMFTLPIDTQIHQPHVDQLLGIGAHSLLDEASRSSNPNLELEIGSQNWYFVRVTSRDGDTLEGSIQDITAKKVAERQLRNLVDHDHLTGLLNRRGLENAVRKATEEVSTRVACAIAHIDIDRFKLFNDLHGFGTGDLLLQQVARRISIVSRSRDSVARVADSFVVVLHDCSEPAAASAMERVREAITSERFDIDGKALNITVSIGVVALDQSMGYADVTAAAGRACSEAKARGRNCVVRLNEHDATLRSHLEELRVVADLQQRIPTDRYFLEFQPIVALQSPQSSLSYEVLIRMRAEDGTVLPPARFIGAAERHGLMSQIDRWVLRSTLEWLDTHPEHRERLAFATINLSGASLNDKRFVDDAFALMADHPLSVAKLCFEITESVALHDMGSTRRFADRVRMHGSKLALDDFGAGYTSFNYLKEIPADFIKIDGSFVKDINRDPANFSITRTIVELTHELGMRSIAEWAETPDTIASLIDLDVDFGQGFGLVRPIAPELVTSALSGGALIQDPQVLRLLEEGPRRPIASSKVRALRSVSR
jgi:diguanylate cyclase (GGDEF)-like protein